MKKDPMIQSLSLIGDALDGGTIDVHFDGDNPEQAVIDKRVVVDIPFIGGGGECLLRYRKGQGQRALYFERRVNIGDENVEFKEQSPDTEDPRKTEE